MGIEIRLPQITGATEKEQLAQIKSYLYQFAEQLQWGLQNVDTSNSAVVVQEAAKSLYPSGSAGSLGSAGSIQDPLAVFASIKALIIKSADIVDAYYDEITKKLSGLLVAHSDFGTFVQQTEQNVKENSTSIERSFENTQTVAANLSASMKTYSDTLNDKIEGVSDSAEAMVNGKVSELGEELRGEAKALSNNIDDKITGVSDQVSNLQIFVKDSFASIKTGLLYNDDYDVPVYGIEVGQRNEVNGVEVFNKFARFTSDRLSFYDKGGHEVAYISDQKLHITKAEVKGEFKFGGYLVTAAANGGLTGRWAVTTQEGSE